MKMTMFNATTASKFRWMATTTSSCFSSRRILLSSSQHAAGPYAYNNNNNNNVAWKSTAASSLDGADAMNENGHPTLTEIPSLPFLGTFVPSYSGTPEFSTKTQLEYWLEMRRRFGRFYRVGIPGFGNGLHGHIHIIQDPNEMKKLLRSESSSPSGLAESAWGPKVYASRHYNPAAALVGPGNAEWKRIRQFTQTDLMSPQSARRYLPAALEAARQASASAPLYGTSMNKFLNLASFEMFVNIMLGYLPDVTNPNIERNEEDLEFCNAVATALRAQTKLMSSIYDVIMVQKIGIDTDRYKTFHNNWATVQRIANKKVDELFALRKTNELTLTQQHSYVNQSFDRQEAQDDITFEEARDIMSGLLSAGVDTTSNMLTWPLLHVAMSPEAQEKVVEELTPQLDDNGHLTEESMSPSNSPYLHAVVRESHRAANPAINVPMKCFDQEVEVHGVKLPPGSYIALDSYSTGQDPELVDDPKEFRPERFLPEAIEARKGTKSEIIDHVFFKGPFSQGARRCPGSRVAHLEAHCFLAQLMLDHKMSIPSLNHWTDCPYDQDTMTAAQFPTMEFVPRT